MEEIKNKETLDNPDAFFCDYFTDIDLNNDMKELYQLIGTEDEQNAFEEEVKLNKLRNENYKRYHEINILIYQGLPDELSEYLEDMFDLYNYIDSEVILIADNYESNNIKILLDNIYRRKNRLDRVIKTYLKELSKNNEERQSKFSINYFKSINVDEQTKKHLLDMYNELVLISSNFPQDIYEDLKIQSKRDEYIRNILKLLNIEEERKINLEKKDKLNILNKKIDLEILKYKEQIQYLEDIIPNKSKYTKEFENFKDFCNKLIAYDDTSYENAKQTFEILSDELRFKTYINNFEELFIQEIIDKEKEEMFIFEKIGIKNLKKSLDYITSNYMDILDNDSKNIVEYIFEKIKEENYDLKELNKSLGLIVKKIWKNTVTDVYNFNPDEDYCFICSNNQFVDPRQQTILITKKEINRVDDYEDYQIGFICNYDDNILYITENEDIMSVEDYDDMSNLKTPIQLEQEFINFKICNRIALNGFKTKIEAVYYINDNNMEKYIKATELANMYKLPLIVLKKDN